MNDVSQGSALKLCLHTQQCGTGSISEVLLISTKAPDEIDRSDLLT